MPLRIETPHTPVHCRTGSLETLLAPVLEMFKVHCRTGSLEIYQWAMGLE